MCAGRNMRSPIAEQARRTRPYSARTGLCRPRRDRHQHGTVTGAFSAFLSSDGLRFARDAPLEGTGFDPSVPREEKWPMSSSSDQTRVGRTLTLGGSAESSPEGKDIELSVSSKDIRTSPYNLCANRSDRRQSREGDRWFESTSLQRRVSCEPDFLDLAPPDDATDGGSGSLPQAGAAAAPS